MIKLIAAAGFLVAVATSAHAITPASISQPDGMLSQVRFGCGPFRTRVAGILRGQNHHPPYPPTRPPSLPPRLLSSLQPLMALVNTAGLLVTFAELAGKPTRRTRRSEQRRGKVGLPDRREGAVSRADLV